MKCPKCGYNSFEYLDNCKKCNNELSGFKATHGIRAVVLPFRPLEHAVPPTEERVPAPQTSSVADADDAMFSWQNEPAEPSSAGAEGFPSLALGQPEPEAEPFSFDLDLPLATPEEGVRKFALEDLGGESGLSLDDAFSGAEQLREEHSPQEETPFGDFSFDDLYKQETAQDEPENSFSGFMEPAEAVEAIATGPAEFSFDDLETNETSVVPSKGDAVVSVEPPTALAFDEFPFEETTLHEESGDEPIDSMGLSAEEYESLFGEAPPKKKSATS